MSIRPCYAEVDLNILEQNYFNIKQATKKNIIPVVKANAYGHGLVEVAKKFAECGANMLAVATVEEAIELRNYLKNVEILILGHVINTQVETCINNHIKFPVSSLESALYVSNIARKLNKNAYIHFAIDTGMGRIGYLCHNENDAVVDTVVSIDKLSNINLDGIFTHFASADDINLDFTIKQYNIFKSIVLKLKNKGVNPNYIHCQNSAATFTLDDDFCNAVRVGISLYGYKPSEFVDTVAISPCLSWVCKITHLKKVPKGTPIGYGSTYITTRDSVIATIPVGYADGFRRALSNKGLVLYNNIRVPVVGNVCMDQTMIDVTDVKECSIGDKIYLISKDNTAEDMAKQLDAISYEVLCDISSRVPRVYI